MSEQTSSLSTPTGRPVRVLKFGGTSVGTADHLEDAVQVICEAQATCQPVVVVSAAAGITDDLVRAAAETRADRSTADAWARHIGRRYRTLANDVLDAPVRRTRYQTVLQAELSELRRALQALNGTDAAKARYAVLATGERLMAPLMAAAIAAADGAAWPVDATALIRTDAQFGDATVQWPATREQVRDWFETKVAEKTKSGVPVVTGFIGGTEDGATATLGRGGSDLSAAVLARALEADRLERWTDVDGLYTRDPAIHDDARRLDQLDFEQARTWTKAGRLGMHPCTLDPLAAADIPIHIQCTHQPDAEGTRIVPASAPVRR